MWVRKDLKANAKSVLKGRYWTAILTCLVTGVLTGNMTVTIKMPSGKDHKPFMENFDRIKEFFTDHGNIVIPIIAAMVVIGLAVLCITVAYSLFIANPARVGQNRFFLENRNGKTETGRMFAPFGKGYMNVVKTMFLKYLYIFLWSLLFIIPGIIKSFEYFAIDYILAENPEMDRNRVFGLSKSMTSGEKWKIFVLMLSFIGWGLLCILTLGIGFIFLMPYIQATLAELYSVLRTKALDMKSAAEDELPGVKNACCE
jgi:uncharacterized membrane protein